MKKITLILTAAILMAGLISTTSFKSSPPSRPSANGHGTITVAGDLTRQFSFHANTMPNGDVQGNGVLTITGGGRQIKFDITCLTVVGNQARMSGTITDDNEFPQFIGTGCRFRVVDNGEGSNAADDQISLLNFGFTGVPPCNNVPLGLFLVEGGNIQVKN